MSNVGSFFSKQEDFAWLEAALAVVSDATVGVNVRGEIQLLNPAAEELLGLSRELALGRPAADVIRIFEAETGRALPNPLVESVRQQAAVRAHPSSRLRGAGGRDVIVEGRAEPVRTAEGELLGAVFVFRDLAPRRQAEALLRQAQKSEVIGQLRAGIAHDFNNLMTIILGFSELILNKTSKLPSAADLQDPLLEIKAAAEKAAQMTQQILALGRRNVPQTAPVNLNDVVRALEKTLGRVLGENIRVKTLLDADVPLVMVDPVKIQQAILHLAVNAREATPRDGDLIIRTARLTPSSQGQNGAAPVVMAELSVADSGAGMDDATLARAREPFFTTREGASGMGLTAVDEIAREFGGALRLESAAGQGTKATLTLPAGPQPQASKAITNEVSPEVLGSEAILLVEDADRVRRLLVRVLEEAGYTVLQANNGRTGLEMCKQHEGRIQLVVTDVIMPEMTGPELVRSIMTMKCQPRVLFLSGHTGDELKRQGINPKDYHFLQKPFLGEALLKKVREVLGGAAVGQ